MAPSTRVSLYMETDIRYNKALEMLEGYFTAFHKVGSDAYKPGLERSQALDAALGYPFL
mgnify:CR=1 FL=1